MPTKRHRARKGRPAGPPRCFPTIFITTPTIPCLSAVHAIIMPALAMIAARHRHCGTNAAMDSG